MKASYIIALFAALAVTANAWESGIKDSKVQGQDASGNNGVYASSDGSLVGVPGAAQEGVNVLADKTNVADADQKQKQ